MNYGLIAAIMMAILGSFVPDDPSGPWRSFINADARPYGDGNELEIPFTYVSNVVEPTHIEIFFDNDDYHHALIYSRYFDRVLNFASSVVLPTFLLEHDVAQLTFEAYNDDFRINQPLPLFKREVVQISEFETENETSVSVDNITFIDYTGTLGSDAERVTFKGFAAGIATPAYGSFPVETFALTIANPSDQTLIFADVNLLIRDLYHDFPLLEHTSDGSYAIIAMKFAEDGDRYILKLGADLYVDPVTFIVADHPVDGFVPSGRLYFPKDRFQALRTLSFQIEGSITMLNQFRFHYDSVHYFEHALIGTCEQAAYCVTTSTTPVDVGLWKEITVTDA
jgi:hypothetical protein